MVKTKMKIEDIEADLDELSLIKLRGNKKYSNFKEVLNDALLGKSTIMVHNGNTQCGSNRARGFADLYRLTKYYFPKTSLKQIINFVNSEYSCNLQQCYETNQTVCYKIYHNYRGNKLKENEIIVRLKNRKKVFIES